MKQQNFTPLVSIVLATYNGERFLSQLLDSVLNQDYPNIEIIATDDASTDNTFVILQEYANKYGNVKIFQNEKNIGPNKTFEKSMLLSNAEYIAIADQDDIWYPNKITILMNEFKGTTIVYHDSELIDEEGKKIGKKISDLKQLINFDNCLQYSIGNSAPGHTMLFRSSLFKKCLPFPSRVTYDLWLGFNATFENGLKYVDRVLVQYRQHQNNVYGAIKVKNATRFNKSKFERRKIAVELSQERIMLLFEKCPNEFSKEKLIFEKLAKSFQSYSLKNNFIRMILLFKYNKQLMVYKKRSQIRRWLYSIKTFFKIPV